MAITAEQIVDGLLQVIDQYHQALLVHDAETVKDIQIEADGIYKQYVTMTQ